MRPEETYENMLELAKSADDLGYFGAFLNDHVIGFGDDGRQPYLEAWTAMTGIGVETKQLRVGQIVLFNSLRNPAFLAKSIATLDNMTDGRYELLIGAGWNEKEYIGYDLMGEGSGMPSAGERVDRFAESIDILNLMLSQEVTDYNGEYWKLDRAWNMPQPVQQPMRLSVGCKGSRMMGITAKNADGINLSGSYIPKILELINKFERIAKEETGKKREDYYISGFSSVHITDDEETIQTRVKRAMERNDISSDEAKNNIISGSKDHVITKLRALKEKGMKMMVVSLKVDNQDQPLAYFKDEVLSEL